MLNEMQAFWNTIIYIHSIETISNVLKFVVNKPRGD